MNIEKSLLACIRKADYNFNLINQGDRILVGLSGGKDSMALVSLLSVYRRFSTKHFTFVAAFIDLGFPEPEIEGIKKFCEDLQVECQIIKAHDVALILNAHRDPKTNLLPCSICSRMKKAVINKAAIDLGITKVAFAHHCDDAIETVFMNMTYGGRVNTFTPKMFLSKDNITFIRPLIYARETEITRYCKEKNIQVFKNKCGNDKKTQRESFKEFLTDFYKKYPPAYENFKTLLTNKERFQLFFDDYCYSFEDGSYLKEVSSYKDYVKVIGLRKKIFIEEQNVPVEEELDDKDEEAIHYLLMNKDEPIGCLRVLLNEDEHFAKIGRFCIKKEYRQKWYGKRMMIQVEKILSQKITPLTLKLDAQLQAQGFYESLGYQKENDKIFLDAGIEHCSMVLYLANPILDKQKVKGMKK